MFSEEELNRIEQDLGITPQEIVEIDEFLKKHHEKEVKDVFMGLFAEPQFNELQRLFCAYCMGIMIAEAKIFNSSAFIITNVPPEKP